MAARTSLRPTVSRSKSPPWRAPPGKGMLEGNVVVLSFYFCFSCRGVFVTSLAVRSRVGLSRLGDMLLASVCSSFSLEIIFKVKYFHAVSFFCFLFCDLFGLERLSELNSGPLMCEKRKAVYSSTCHVCDISKMVAFACLCYTFITFHAEKSVHRYNN